MATFLFWNTNKKDLTSEISALCDEHDVDVVIIAELKSELSPGALQSHLNEGRERLYYLESKDSSSLIILHRYPQNSLTIMEENNRYVVCRLKPPISPDMLVVAVHLPSKLFMENNDQSSYADDVSQTIREAEKTVGHARTIVIGDFNMNPFEEGIVASKSFHAVMDRTIAMKESREVFNKKYLYLYNPMWGRLGDNSKGPPGTYYYPVHNVSYFWNTFDQVLLRPALLEYFDDDSLKILTEVEGRSLLKTSSPGIDKKMFSDHLPIVASIDID